MISVLICSANESFLKQVKNNIEQTIGVEYELLSFDNGIEKKGICAVYNILAGQARFPYLCFVHEDILFQTTNWGQVINDVFSQQADTGVIGVAGCKYKSKLFSGWFSGNTALDCAQITHRYSDGDEVISLGSERQKGIEEVVCIDGVFICCRQEIWKQIKFNEDFLRGFHFYDLDFSLQASAVTKVMVTYQIEMLHITTGGDFGNNWVTTAIDYHECYRENLPNVKLVAYSAGMEIDISRTWLDVLKKYKISWKNRVRWVTMQRLYHHPSLYYPVVKFLFYKSLGLARVHKLIKRTR